MKNTALELEYNSKRSPLLISEYGRNVQKMIEHAVSISDRAIRSEAAKAIINVMGQMNPHLRDVNDFKHKLWDHLFIISGFKIDVDSPYPTPTAESVKVKPDRLKYPASDIRFRHYGKTIHRMIEKAVDYPEGEEKDMLIQLIANHMKKCFLIWNRDSVEDSKISQDLQELSGGKLRLSDKIRLNQTTDILATANKKRAPVKSPPTMRPVKRKMK